ncbi:hypothetical protein EFS21_00020 [Levilactobacillus brevis]|uniref:Mor transcription activator domain-containing protein n=2 Tax=Levilactobacillus brevis TaxID=1580 RepID=Q03RZ9_LEVBA|nr:Mor transcription activator family protein [Levilactobacillus brevis]ABJ64023.1 hypothetical protein LVIS_0886 [Levilactobacillus brevis ATCC 367]KWT51269.1 hypothetical protein ABB39_02605 [Levilactobacillus brevis]KWU39950.1 hypothetical protein AV935_01000 [Levilactobacillus brevis]MCB4356600.1 hypothetical protein [Levilactobacillus brevis]MCS6163947.1 hypothetical protein [Levilactobacillus brevis]
MKRDDWQIVYQELADIIGETATRKVYQHFRGSSVSFPLRLLTHQALVTRVQQDYTVGMTIHELAHKYQLADRTVRNYLWEKVK